MSNPVGAARVTIEADAGPAADSIVDLMDAALDRVVTVAGNAFTQVEQSADRSMDQVAQAARSGAAALDDALSNIDVTGMDNARASAARLGDALQQARQQEAQAARAANAAEQELQRVRNRAGATADEIAQAERRANAELGRSVLASRDAARAAEQYEQAQRDAAGAAEESSNSASGFGDSIGDMAGQLAGAAAGIAGLTAVTATLSESFDRADIGNKLKAQLDLTTEESAKAGKMAGDIYAQNYGESFEQVNEAIGAVHSSLSNLTDSPAEVDNLTKAALTLAQTFGVDVAESANTANIMIRNGIAKDGAEAFDLLGAAMQRVPAQMRDELIPIVDEYATYLTSMGFTGQEAMGVIVNAAYQGAIGMDKAGDAIKEFGIRATDLGDTGAQEALKSIGLNGEEMANQLLAGGDVAKGAFDRIVSGLSGIQEPGKQAAAAVALFGTPLEDIDKAKIPGFLAGLQNADSAMGDFGGTITEMGNSLAEGPNAKLETFKRQVQQGMIDTLGTASGYLLDHKGLLIGLGAALGTVVVAYGAIRTAAMISAVATGIHTAATGGNTAALATNKIAMGAAAITSGVMKAGQLAGAVATGVMTAAQWALNSALLANPMTWVVLAIVGLIAAVVAIATKTTWFQTIWDTVWGAIQVAIDFTWNSVLRPVFDAIIAAMHWVGDAAGWLYNAAIKPAFDAIMWVINLWWTGVQLYFGLVTGVFHGLINTAVAVKDGVVSAFNWVKDSIGDAATWIGQKVEAIVGFFTGIGGRITTATSGMWNGLLEAFKSAINWIIDGWNGLEFTLPEVDTHIPGVGKVGGWTLGTPDIPRLATGGLFRGKGGPREDANLAALSDREFVVNAPMTDKWGWLLELINGNKLPGFADGGAVGGAAAAIPSFGSGPSWPELAQIVVLLQQIAANTATGAVGAPAGGVAPDVGAVAPTADPGAIAASGAAEVADGWQASADSLTAVKDGQIDPALTALQQQVVDYGANTQTQLATVVDPAWAASASNLALTKTSVIDPTLAGLDASTANTALMTQGAVFGQINPAWQAMGGNVMAVKTGTVDPALAGMQGAVWNTANAFGAGAASIATQWNQVREATAAPVRFAIGAVFNDGIVGMWNSVSDLLGTQKMGTYPIRFATGGIVPGAGAEDKIPALVMPKEFVVPRGMAAAIGGGNLDRGLQMLDSVRQRGPTAGLGAEGLFSGIAGRYAAGGVVQGTPAWEAMKRGHAFAARWNGAPYVWGGSLGPDGGTDCSGYMSSIADVILGGSGLQRQWATGSFPGGGGTQGAGGPQGFVQGLGAGMSIGVSVEHTAGTLGGIDGLPTVNIESGGSHGNVAYGGPAVGADNSQFPSQYHLPIVAGAFMSGGGGGGSTMSMQDIVGGITGPAWDKIMSTAGSWTGGGLIGSYPSKLAEKMKGATTAKIDKLVQEMSTFADPGGAGVERWRPLVTLLLKRYSLGEENADRTLRRMNQESSGNPRAINLDDSNAKAGTPSKGLMQVIDPTFAAHRDPALSADIWDPMANVGASMRYAMAQYGSLAAAYDKAGGYDRGGLAKGTGIMLKDVISPERVLDPQTTQTFDKFINGLKVSGSGSVSFGGLTVSGSGEMRIDGDRVAAGFSGVTSEGKRVEVRLTQHIYGDDPKRTADEVHDRLLSLIP